MVAVINTGNSISRTLNYNEQKVREGKAELLSVAGYFKPANELSFSAKLNRLERQAALNENVTRNSVHISLNFHNEDNLSAEQLKAIAATYMQGIGFGDQPYLVYQHHDAGHKHMHIVTTKIDNTGKRIDMNNIGRGISAKVREQIEQEYGLVKAKGRKVQEAITPAKIVRYGKAETKQAIANVLARALHQYSFTSLPELNAILKAYNVRAETGEKKSRLKQYGGLMYQVLSDKGEPIGVPIKASLFHNNPGLKFLQEKFVQNENGRQFKKRAIKNAVDFYFIGNRHASIQDLSDHLKTKAIDLVQYKNAQGMLYGITFVDHQNRAAFSGSDLGKTYSAAAIQQRCAQSRLTVNEARMQRVLSNAEPDASVQRFDPALEHPNDEIICGVVDSLMIPDKQFDYVDPELKRKKKKRNI